MNNSNVNIKYINLTPGMYVFSYLHSLTPNTTPVVTFAKRPQFASGTMSCIYSNDENDGQLSAPGECVVVRVGKSPIQLQVSIYDEQNETPDVEMKIQTLTQQAKSLTQQAAPAASKTDSQAIDKVKQILQQELQDKQADNKAEISSHHDNSILVQLSGHVEWKGDIEAKPGKWLGNKKGKDRIEAFNLDWLNKPKGLKLSYSCQVEGLGELPVVKAGNFVGTKQKALPIQAIAFKLTGKKAASYQLLIQASFSETGVQKCSGHSCDLKALHDGEFLTGLKVQVISDSSQAKNMKKQGKKQNKNQAQPVKSWSNFDDVMVFKS